MLFFLQNIIGFWHGVKQLYCKLLGRKDRGGGHQWQPGDFSCILEAVGIFSIFSKPRTWMYEAGGHWARKANDHRLRPPDNNWNKNSYSLLIARSMSRIAIGVPPPRSFRAIAALFNNMTLCTKSQFCFCEWFWRKVIDDDRKCNYNKNCQMNDFERLWTKKKTKEWGICLQKNDFQGYCP